MRSTKSISEDIRSVEGFDVRFVGVDGEDVSLRRAEDYPYQRAARNAWTVSQWKRERFEVTYPDYRVEVLDPDGTPIHGKTLLENLRLRYVEADDSDESAYYGMATDAAEGGKDEDRAGLPHGDGSAFKVEAGDVSSPGRRPPTPASTVVTSDACRCTGGRVDTTGVGVTAVGGGQQSCVVLSIPRTSRRTSSRCCSSSGSAMRGTKSTPKP